MPDDEPISEVLSELDPATRRRLLSEVARGCKKVATAFGQDVEKTVETLRKDYEAFRKRETFSPGQLVVWKPGMKNRRRPVDGEPAIVVEILDDPVQDTEGGPGSAYYREALDVKLGVLDDDGEFLIFHFDSRRFTAFEHKRDRKKR